MSLQQREATLVCHRKYQREVTTGFYQIVKLGIYGETKRELSVVTLVADHKAYGTTARSVKEEEDDDDEVKHHVFLVYYARYTDLEDILINCLDVEYHHHIEQI